MPKKKFIDKKKSVTFHLVHRSQQDPLVADENAPQHVLLPVVSKSANVIEEQHKFGVYFDDDYNYLQHLKNVDRTMEWVPVAETSKAQQERKSTTNKLKLPSSVFASEVEENVGMLNRAAPQSGLRLDLDADVIAAMDDDFDFEDPDNVLEDNFLELANAEGGSDDEEYDDDKDGEDMDSNFSGEERDELGSMDDGQFTFRDEETKSRFTEYSMTSSVIRRNAQLTLLDDRFEKMYTQYDENEIGALDCDEIEGFVPETDSILIQYAKEFENAKKREQLDKDELTSKIVQMAHKTVEDVGDYDDLDRRVVEQGERWDCESILSTYSNIYNHPKIIVEPKNSKIKLHPRTGVPMNVLDANKLTAHNLSQLDEDYNKKHKLQSVAQKSIISALSTLSMRPKDETPEDRRQRKHKLKEYRQERREERKANTLAFKKESMRQAKIQINNMNNVQGNRIL